MSRIPKIGATGSLKTKNSTDSMLPPPTVSSQRTTSGVLRPGVKRAGESQAGLSEKRQKTNVEAPVKRNGFGSTVRSHTVDKIAAFSDKSKRAVLQPLPDNELVRGSMPAVLPTAKAKAGLKSKRPAWDLKGRIQDMEEHFNKTLEQNSTLKQELQAYNERIAALEAANSLLYKDVEIKSSQSEEASSQISRLENALKQKTEEYDKMAKESEAETKKLKDSIESLTHELTTLNNMYQQETTSLRNSISSLTCSKSGLQAQLDATENMLEALRQEMKQLQTEKLNKEKENMDLLQQVADLESKLRNEESTRRKLHNMVQELKGNIRVYCRVRPLIPEEVKKGISLANVTTSEKIIEINQLSDSALNESGGKYQKKYEFTFDCVFPPTATQEEVFGEISQLVQSSLDGYNVCIFAYGQTGSGKTYTMEGPESIVEFKFSDADPRLGMIPRSVQQIFRCIENLEPRGWKYKVEALFLEIYNERIRDLLNSDSQNGNMKCEIIKSAAKGNDCLISNVTPSVVTCTEEVYELLRKARINRAVAATKCNEYSSRSHYVFQMKIYGENSITSEKCEGTLNLIDLAGSERVKESGSAGERLTEAKAINKSLSNLGNVIMSLSRKDSHIPYRDSKLTHLLANSLGGNSKTLMFVNINPDSENLSETINSLRFATKVNQCNIGTAQKRVK